jgi:hypothetical protein
MYLMLNLPLLAPSARILPVAYDRVALPAKFTLVTALDLNFSLFSRHASRITGLLPTHVPSYPSPGIKIQCPGSQNR